LRNDGLYLVLCGAAALSPEALSQVGRRYYPSIVHIEVMESEHEVTFLDHELCVHRRHQELRVVDRSVVVHVEAVEDLIDVFDVAHRLVYLSDAEPTCIVSVDRPEGIAQRHIVKISRVPLVD